MSLVEAANDPERRAEMLRFADKLSDPDAMTLETIERRKRIEREDRAFVAQLRAAILGGFETHTGVLAS